MAYAQVDWCPNVLGIGFDGIFNLIYYPKPNWNNYMFRDFNTTRQN